MAGLSAAIVTLALSPVAAAPAVAATSLSPPPTLVEYPTPAPDNLGVTNLAVGPDGNVWASYQVPRSAIAQVTPSGVVTEFSLPSGVFGPKLAKGSDGNLWFGWSTNVYRMDTTGTITGTFPVPGTGSIALGSDGNVWVGSGSDQVSSVTPSGAVTTYTSPFPVGVFSMTEGPDGNVWFTDEFTGVVGNITPSGAFTEFVDPTFVHGNGGPSSITVGPDGNLWAAERLSGKIARVTPTGNFTDFYLPPGLAPSSITGGPDGAVWFTDFNAGIVGRITTDGQVGLATMGANSFGFKSRFPQGIITGPDGRLWVGLNLPTTVAAFSPYVPAASPPAITSIAPRKGSTAGGETVDITGYDVGLATQVLFGSTPASSFTIMGPGEVQAVTPPAPSGGAVNVTVVTPMGTTAASKASTYYYGAPGCGMTITVNTTLTVDIGPCIGDGIDVGADGITLNLGGHKVLGVSAHTGQAVGIRLQGRTGVTVKNGAVSGFDAGVAVLRGAGSNTLTHLTVQDNMGENNPFISKFGDGILVNASPHNTITWNTVTHNGIFDGIGVINPGADDNIIEHNTVSATVGPLFRGPAGEGIIINGANGQGASTAIHRTLIENNIVRDNGSAGISDVNEIGAMIVSNTVTGNGRTNSIGNGIGISVGQNWTLGDTSDTIEKNQVFNNGVDGIRIGNLFGFSTGDPQGNTISGNSTYGNAAKPGVDTYEQHTKAYDLHDQTPDCGTDVWTMNSWGPAGFTPACTSNGGTGPTPAASIKAAAAAQPLALTGPDASAWQQFLSNGRQI